MAREPDPKNFVLPSVAAERLRRMADQIIDEAKPGELVYIGSLRVVFKPAAKVRAERWARKPKGKAVAQ